MLKCIITGEEFDDLAPLYKAKNGSELEKNKEEIAVRDHAEKTAAWEFVRVTVLRDGHPLELLSGHVSPSVKLQPGDVGLTKK